MPSKQDQVWLNMWKGNTPIIREKAIGWRKEDALTRIEKPSRIQKARRLDTRQNKES